MLPTIRLLTPVCLLLLTTGTGSQQSCDQEFGVVGSPGTSSARGVFVSDNYPHSLPTGSRCGYLFRVYGGEVFCTRFEELDLFTDSIASADETRIEMWLENDYAPLLEYSGNGSLLREQPNNVKKSVLTRPLNLLEGPLCFSTPNYKNIFRFNVYNRRFIRPANDVTRRFLAKFEKLNRVGNNGTLGYHNRVHRCLDGSVIDIRKRCNYWSDCKPSSIVTSDFFGQMSSDESYEHARCSNLDSFGTSFTRELMSGNRIRDSLASLKCDSESDHSRVYSSVSDLRDCGLSVQQTASYSVQPVLLLRDVRPTMTTRAVCFRLFWKSSSTGSLTLASARDGRALLRLDGRMSNSWSMVEWESAAPSLYTEGYYVYSLRMDKASPSSKHWLDDLSAEPLPCTESAYERRMPAMCSLEWSTCGWKTNLQIVSDSSISNSYRVIFQDRTSQQIPTRLLPGRPQRVLQLRGEPYQWTGSLETNREIPYGSAFCVGFWFYALGTSGYSVRLDAEVAVIVSGENKYFRSMSIAPTNQWRLLMTELIPRQPGIPKVTVSLVAPSRSEVQLVLLDDLMIYADRCRGNETALNGVAECGQQEWSCFNRIQCIPIRKRCDKFNDCSDRSDEAGCSNSRAVSVDSTLLLALKVFIGLAVAVSFVVVICTYLRRGSTSCFARTNAERRSPPRTVTNGRLPGPIRSDRLLSNSWLSRDRPPSYRQVALGGAINAGFDDDEEGAPPPKYEDAVAAMASMATASVDDEGRI